MDLRETAAAEALEAASILNMIVHWKTAPVDVLRVNTLDRCIASQSSKVQTS